MAVGVNRLKPQDDPTVRASGTGGFALIAESGVPVYKNLNDAEGRDTYGLLPRDMDGVSVVSLLARDGDDASCLNLSQASNPRLFGVDPEELALRGSFSFQSGDDPASAWRRLAAVDPDGAIPAVGDAASITWALKKKIGDTLEYVDERGEPILVRIVGAVEGSILQGMLLVDAARFRDHFPAESGYRTFLIDAPTERAPEVSSKLTRALSDVGFAARPTVDRLAELNAVQNTYLAIFQVLGGLGVLLGTAGLAMVVLRNVLERRGELAALRAVGYRWADLRRLLLGEHGLLLLLGLGAGVIAALVAVLPGGRDSLDATPVAIVIAVALLGAVAVLLAAWVALRGSLVDALKERS